MKIKDRERILSILTTLPRIRIRIASYISQAGKPELWEEIKDLCIPLGLVDTAFREHPNLNDYLVSYDYWEEKLGIQNLSKKEIDMRIKGKLRIIQSQGGELSHNWTDIKGGKDSVAEAEIDISAAELARQMSFEEFNSLLMARSKQICEGVPDKAPPSICDDCIEVCKATHPRSTCTLFKPKAPPEPKYCTCEMKDSDGKGNCKNCGGKIDFKPTCEPDCPFCEEEMKEQGIITFEKSALRKICEMLDVPYDEKIIAFTKKGVVKNWLDLIDKPTCEAKRIIEPLKGDWVTDEQAIAKICKKVDELIQDRNKQRKE